MEESKRSSNGDKRVYVKPEMKVEKIHRFFFAMCQTTWPFCYSQHVTFPGTPRCR